MLRVQLVGGAVLESEQVRRARGHASRPLSSAELFEKFRGCLEAGGSSLDSTCSIACSGSRRLRRPGSSSRPDGSQGAIH